MTDDWNKVTDELADDAKNATKNVQNAAEDAWNKVEETTSDATESVKETVSEVPDSAQDLVEEAKDQTQDSWNIVADGAGEKVEDVQETVSGGQDKALDAWDKAVEAAAAKTTEAKEDLGQTAEAAKDTVDGAWSTATEHVEDAAAEVKSDATDSWESAKESTQDEWQKATDEVAKPDPNDPSTWKQEVYAAADTVKTEAGEAIPSWESYKQANPEVVAPLMPEYTRSAEAMQPVVIPPTTVPYGSETKVPPVEPARSFTTQTPAYKPLPAVAKKGLPAWAIVLLVIGALILLCVLLGVIFFGGIIRSILQGAVPLQLVLSQFLV